MTFLMLGIIPVVIVSSAFLNTYYERAIAVRTTDVQNQCKIISNQIVASDYLTSNKSETISGELSLISSLYDGRIMIIDRDLRVITDTYNMEASKTMIVEEVIKCFKTGTSVHMVSGRFIEVAVPIQRVIDGTTGTTETLGVILVSASLDAITDNREVLQNSVDLILTIALIIVMLVAVALAIGFVRPFKRLSKKISAVTAEHMEDEISENAYTETEQIADAFNQLLSKLRLLDESRQEFVSNVSHELKTPLTSMKVLADSLLSQDNVPVELYQEFMGDITEEIERENKIINDLLSLVKMDKTSADLNVKAENINELVEKIKKAIPDIGLTTDIIVGFPGETEEDFLETLDVVRKVRYDSAFTFIYSKRTGTPAAAMENQVPEDVVKDRFDRLLKEVQNISQEMTARFEGMVEEVLVEDVNDHNPELVTGRMSNNHLVHFPGDASMIGKIIKVHLDECKGFYYMGSIVED